MSIGSLAVRNPDAFQEGVINAGGSLGRKKMSATQWLANSSHRERKLPHPVLSGTNAPIAEPKSWKADGVNDGFPASGSGVGTVRRPHRVIPDKSVAFWPTRVMASCR
jgi:hypothetical protein